MNAKKKTQLEKMKADLNNIIGKLEDLRDEEQETFDNRSEKYQESENGTDDEQTISDLSDALDQLEQVDTILNEVIER